MKTIKRILFVLLTATLLCASAVIPASALQAGDTLDLTGIGTDSLKYFSFYYTKTDKGQDPISTMKPLTRVKFGARNGSWPFNMNHKLYAYEDPSWPTDKMQGGSWTNLQYVYFVKNDPSMLFVYTKFDKDTNTNYRSVVAFTAPAEGNYTLSFDGSVSWSADSVEMETYVNGVKTGDLYVFTTQIGEMVSEGVTKAYSITCDLKQGQQICLVFHNNARSENRANLQNLKVKVNSCKAPVTEEPTTETPTTQPPVTTPETSTTEKANTSENVTTENKVTTSAIEDNAGEENDLDVVVSFLCGLALGLVIGGVVLVITKKKK